MQKKWIAVAAAVFAAGIAAGSLAAVKTVPETLYGYFSSLAGGEITARTGAAVVDALILWAVLFFSAFFRLGMFTAAVGVGAKGFCDGYAIAAIMRILGVHGLGLCFFDILNAPAAILLAALSMGVLLDGRQSRSGYIVSGVMLLILSLLFASAGSMAAASITAKILAGMEF